MDNPFQSPTILSLCTGGRMLERGVERAIGAVRTIAYVEIEAFCIWNLVAQMEQGMVAPTPVWTDCKTFPAKQFYRKIHGIIGGYPCQPFSVAGKRKGEEDARHLWPHIRGIVNAVKPLWCFFENVPGHLAMGFGTVYRELRDLGYSVEGGIYSAAEAGAPHQRERLFILALDNTTKQGSQRCGLTGIGKLSKENNQGMHNRSKQSGYELAHTGNQGLERYRNGKINPSKKQPMSACIGSNKWPAPPPQPQYEWEEKRTVEPWVGCTIDGYNFREDLLRMYGNAVVEQTAEIAFIDLLKKHLSLS